MRLSRATHTTFIILHAPDAFFDSLRLAVLIPCYNEAATVRSVVRDFRAALPNASIYAVDNNSTDNTSDVARATGAVVRQVGYQGKGNVIRRMFADIDADVYVLVDGDDTYDAADEQEAYRLGHRFGNVMLTRFVASIFGRTFTDMSSGYRVFSRRYVKSFPAHSKGFENETELTVHALELRMPVAEIATRYKSRPEGSVSKLNTYRDGFRILSMIVKLFRAERPLAFFSSSGRLRSTSRRSDT